MFSFFSKKEDFNAQSTHFNNAVVNTSTQNFNFMKDSKAMKEFNPIIDNMLVFLKDKLKYAQSIQNKSSSNFKLSDLKMPEEEMKFFVSLGMINIITDNEAELKKYLQLVDLSKAEFQQKVSVIPGFVQYMNEYINKLTILKELSIEKEQLPENTGFQLELRQKLDYILQKNKAMIFDIYLNHYIQYMYLLFAINIFKNTEAFFKINAEQQKQIALLTKTDGLISAIESLTSNDDENIKRINENIQYLIDQTSKVSEFNKIDPKNLGKLQKLNENTAKLNKKTKTGGSANIVSTPAADGLINQIITKHKYFYELYTTTRNAMPGYFKSINDMIIEKINKLQDMKSQIVNLTNKDVELLTKTNNAISKFMDTSTNKDLQKGYTAESHPSMESLKQRLNLISNEIESSIKSATQQAAQVSKETDRLQNVVAANPVTASVSTPVAAVTAPVATAPVATAPVAPVAQAPVAPVAQAPVDTAPAAPVPVSNPAPPMGGFVRSGTRFPKNNYKTKKFDK